MLCGVEAEERKSSPSLPLFPSDLQLPASKGWLWLSLVTPRAQVVSSCPSLAFPSLAMGCKHHPALVTSFPSSRPESGFVEQMKYLRYVLVVGGFCLFVWGRLVLNLFRKPRHILSLAFVRACADVVFYCFFLTRSPKTKFGKRQRKRLSEGAMASPAFSQQGQPEQHRPRTRAWPSRTGRGRRSGQE